MAPVQPAGDVLVQRPIPTISAERLKELRAELPEVIYGEINLLYSTGRYADAILVTELLLDANSQNALAWSWKATLERKQGHYASADLAAERINACLMVQGLDATTLALGLEKIQGADRIYLSNAPQPTSLAVAQEIANRPWRKQPGTQLTSR